MTLGTGIFASTVLVLLAIAIWQITVRHKWKLAGKIAAGFVAVCAVVGGGLYAWNYIANLPPAPSVVTELAGVKLGMSPTDVTLALGKPDTASDPSVKDGETRIEFKYSSSDNYSSPNVSIIFYGRDKYTTKASIVCSADSSIKLLGFDNYSAEANILQSLGKPSSVSVASDALSKIISYSQWKVAFTISKGFVSEKCITQSGSVTFADELISPEAQKVADQKAAAEAKAAAIRAAEQRIAAEAKEAEKRAVEEEAAKRKMLAEQDAAKKAVAAELERVRQESSKKLEAAKARAAAEAAKVQSARSIASLIARAKDLQRNGNSAAAFQQYILVARNGNEEAMFNVAMMYRDGNGVKQDYRRAYMWLSQTGSSYGSLPNLERAMTIGQIAEAQAMARKCQASNFKQCD